MPRIKIKPVSLDDTSYKHLEHSYQEPSAKQQNPSKRKDKKPTTTGNNHRSVEVENIFTVVDVFSSRVEMRNAIAEFQRQGLRASQIVVITKNYQDHEDSMNWEYITKDGDLPSVLIGLGLDAQDIFKFENAVANGSFLVVAIITDRSVSQAQHLLANIGHKVISVY
ncbi:hypothetical protein H6F42_17145 [Pseudanabaena sp. FACHB-1998]|uniref:hypothetical protein n=1 Tax=Pseudanabaena sp. FACHB-1998 TaxID=2692858 RepID=UPI0016808D1D|nr:hypothetical protein [Pseudanabaena sp. FACHB-1998]MBD2178647.1 hypothetical protein [Pseudanabaena sp. FACHB-1998]